MAMKIIDNFNGALTRQNIGDMNSGLAKFNTTFGNNPFIDPSNLTWFEQPTSIFSFQSPSCVGVVVAAKTRIESGNEFVYTTFSGDGSVVTINKIQVNDSSGKNPNYDHPSVIGALSTNIPTSRWGGSLQFYGATEKLFIGVDNGMYKASVDGTSQVFLGSSSSIMSNVPRPTVNFLGKIYFGNGNNIGEIDSTEAITNYAKLNPGFPVGTYVRDLDVTPDGNYLQITVSRLNQTQLNGNTLDTTSASSVDSYKFLWNGTDAGYTSYETYNGYALTANTTFSNKNFTLGLDLGGGALYSGSDKIISFPNAQPTNFGAMFSTGNLVGFMTPEYNSSIAHLQGSGYFYGQYDEEVPKGLYRFIKQSAVLGTDVMSIPMATPVSNNTYSPNFFGYSGNRSGVGKLYYSTTEVDAGGNPSFILWKFTTVPQGMGTAIGGVYETQQETSLKLFRSIVSRKFKPTQVRFYVSPLVANNSFQIDIIGSDGNPMPGATQTFTVGTNCIVGQDYLWYTPQTAPTYSMGVRITNLGTANWTGVKLEVEYEEAGV